VIEIDSTHSQAHNNLAVIFYHQKNYEKSWEHIKKAENLGLKAHPDFKKELLKKLKKGKEGTFLFQISTCQNSRRYEYL